MTGIALLEVYQLGLSSPEMEGTLLQMAWTCRSTSLQVSDPAL